MAVFADTTIICARARQWVVKALPVAGFYFQCPRRYLVDIGEILISGADTLVLGH